MKTGYVLLCAVLGFVFVFSVCARADWGAQGARGHYVREMNGRGAPIEVPAQFQIVTEKWNRVVAVPYIVYMPEKDEILMLASCDYPHQAVMLSSRDHGATWSDPRFVHTDAGGQPDTGMGTSLTYLGNGRVLLVANQHWVSADYGATWNVLSPVAPAANGQSWYMWDPLFVDKDGSGVVQKLIETGYTMDSAWYEGRKGPGYSTAHLRSSSDGGLTWSEPISPPQWKGVSEVTLVRAKNGDLVAACRTDIPTRLINDLIDHNEGLATCVSSDDGKTWSELNRLYEWGRHHPHMLLMPSGDIVMTYVVRRGYTPVPEGYPRFGVEAVVSRDNGKTWDLDHRYILHFWVGNRLGENAWWPSSQATSSVLLPDGQILTVFGTGFRSQPNERGQSAPRDVGLVLWRLSDGPINEDRPVRDAAHDSDTRNVFDPVICKPAAVP